MILTQLLMRPTIVAASGGWTALGMIGSGFQTTDGAGVGIARITSTQVVPAGSVVIMTGGSASIVGANFGTCTDSAGNTYTLIGKQNSVAVYYSKITNPLAIGSTVTATVTSSGGSFSNINGVAWAFGIPAGKTVNFTTPQVSSNSTFTDSLTLSGLPSREYLFFRTEVGNNVQSAFPITATPGFTLNKYTRNGGEGLYGEYIIEVGTGKTSNPSGQDGSAVNGRWVYTGLYLT